jgi:hypothetical protein
MVQANDCENWYVGSFHERPKNRLPPEGLNAIGDWPRNFKFSQRSDRRLPVAAAEFLAICSEAGTPKRFLDPRIFDTVRCAPEKGRHRFGSVRHGRDCSVCVWPAPKEPEYEGLTLSGWLLACTSGYTSITRNGHRHSPDEAIRHIGTNAVPYLVRWISEEPWWRKGLYKLREKLPGTLQRSAPGRWILNSEFHRQRRRSGARDGIFILGTDAGGAVPDIYVLAKSPDRLNALMAVELLDAIGDPAVPALYRLTNAPDKDVRIFAFRALHTIGLRKAASETRPGTQGPETK